VKAENIAVIITAVIGIIVAGTALIQVDIFKQEFESTNRPWIQISKWDKEKDLEFTYKNFGKIPNSGGMLIVHISTQPIERKDFDNLAVIEQLPPTTIREQLPPLAPDVELNFKFNPEIKAMIQNACDSNIVLFLGIQISFEYLDDKSGEYGEILEFKRFDDDRCLSVFYNSWIK